MVVFLFDAFPQSGIVGKTKNSSGEPLAFATVYVKGTTNGTISNANADYILKLEEGTYTIIAQYVGYQPVERKVTIYNGKMTNLDFILQEQALQLKTVVVTADEQDPAYRIIREAIKKRKYYENEVKAFKCDAYIKGLQRLDKKPDKILGIKVTIDTGIVYLSESISKLAFEQPDKVSERMISSKVSGNDQAFSFNQASDFNFNLYQKNFDFDGLVERSLISPISSQAFFFYDYEWLGAFEENGRLINKIRLLPKRDADPVFDGIIYIVEDSWRIHTVDLLLVQSRGVEFADSIKINQVLASVDNGMWMPISQRFSFQFKAFGFKGSGYFIGVYSNYEVEPNYPLLEQEIDTISMDTIKQVDLFDESHFTPEVLYVEEGSNERDSMYWQNVRPIPLTQMEVEDYRIKDSIRIVKESIPYKDSIDAVRNKLTLGNVFISGYTHFNSVKENFWNIPPVLSLFQYNTVEGFVLNMEPSYFQQENNRTRFWIDPSLRYGTASERFYGKLKGGWRKFDNKFTLFEFSGGQYVFQYDEEEAIAPLINTYATLVNGDNFMKLYQKTFVSGRFEQEIKNGIRLNSTLSYAIRDTLTNNKIDYSWAGSNEVNFTPNQPANVELNDSTGFATNNALLLDLNFRIRFKQKYATRPDFKFVYTSKYPEINIGYRKGIKALGSDVDFDFVSVAVSDDFKLGLIGTSNYWVSIGTFLNERSLTFVDFKHFAGNETGFSSISVKGFQILPYYVYSTTNRYIEAHYEHHFNEFIFNKLPLVRRLNLQAVGSLNYLNSKTVGDFFEIGGGIEHIFKFLRVDYWWAMRNGKFFGNGLRVGFGF
jgi:hypothetical protein